jgi:serine/threonine protein phosphatase PrpC
MGPANSNVAKGNAMNTSDASQEKLPSAGQDDAIRRQHGEIYRRLIRGLFGGERNIDIQLFDGGVSGERLEKFATSDAVFEAATDFVKKLSQIWEVHYPDEKKLWFIQPGETGVKKYEFPKLDDAPLALPNPTSRPATRPTTGPATSNPSRRPQDQGKDRRPQDLKAGQIPTTTMPPTTLPPSPPPRFQLPNCKAGVPYAGKIECSDASVVVTSVDFPDKLGADLAFDPKSQILQGTTSDVGEFELRLSWRKPDAASRSASCHFTVIADPRSLWRVNEPDARLPYPKPHLAHRQLSGANFGIAAASRRGRSHEHGGSFRDDDFFIARIPENGWNILIVADGAGSAACSREGARLAVETAGHSLQTALRGKTGEDITRFLDDWEAQKKAIYDLAYLSFQNAAKEAVSAITAEAEKTGAPFRDYSTTLLAVILRPGPGPGPADGNVHSGSADGDVPGLIAQGENCHPQDDVFLASFWMGDGAIAAYGPHGTVKLMGVPDSGEFAGQTRFLDTAALRDPEFYKRIKVERLSGLKAVLLMTDGVSDPRFETDNGLNDPAKWDALWDEISPLLADPHADEKLLEWLHFFVPGHHDDRTIALQWWFGGAPS